MKEWTNSDLAVINGGFIRGDKLYTILFFRF